MSSPSPSPQRCTVLLAGPFHKAFDYTTDTPLACGTIVEVPLGKRTHYGIVWPQNPDPKLQITQLKPVIASTRHIISQGLIQTILWMSRYNLIPLGQLVKLVIAGIDPQSQYRTKPIDFETTLPHEPLDLSAAQQQAFTQLTDALVSAKPLLIDGVTGSGKTEVYLKLIQKTLDEKKQALVLLPEIALTPEWGERFRARMGTDCYIWHSQVGTSQKKAIWHHSNSGSPCVVVGARSALFLPFSKLGLIVVDEEHDASFKQDDNPVYHARDSAIVRAHHEKIPIVLSTATASLETFWNVRKQKYSAVAISQRYANAQRPQITTCDLRSCKRHANDYDVLVAQDVIDRIEQNLNKREQSLLFLNRRGYAPMNICGGCGAKRGCPQCSTLLVEHRKSHQFLCHQCGWSAPLNTACFQCGSHETIHVGSGVERVYDMIRHTFPQARTAIVSSDHMPAGESLESFLQAVRNNTVDILVGTQILAKGHNFPDLTFVAILDADAILNAGAGLDLRAAERTFQLIEQVSGRAGRAEKPGQVMLQTYQPEHPVIQALVSQDRETFYQLELEQRRMALMPPFGRLIALIVSSPQLHEVRSFAHNMKDLAPRDSHVKVYGPAPAPIEKIRNHYRWRFLLHAPRNVDLSAYTAHWMQSLKVPKNMRIKVDVDPYNFQ